jgi:hypothetical protein
VAPADSFHTPDLPPIPVTLKQLDCPGTPKAVYSPTKSPIFIRI